MTFYLAIPVVLAWTLLLIRSPALPNAEPEEVPPPLALADTSWRLESVSWVRARPGHRLEYLDQGPPNPRGLGLETMLAHFTADGHFVIAIFPEPWSTDWPESLQPLITVRGRWYWEDEVLVFLTREEREETETHWTFEPDVGSRWRAHRADLVELMRARLLETSAPQYFLDAERLYHPLSPGLVPMLPSLLGTPGE